MNNNSRYSSVHNEQSTKKNALRQFFFSWLVIRAMTTSIFSTDWRRFSLVLSMFCIPLLSYHFSKNKWRVGRWRREEEKNVKPFFWFFFFLLHQSEEQTYTHALWNIRLTIIIIIRWKEKEDDEKETERERKGMSWALCGCSFSLSNYVCVCLFLSSFSSLFTIHIFFSVLFIRSFVCWWSNVCLDR